MMIIYCIILLVTLLCCNSSSWAFTSSSSSMPMKSTTTSTCLWSGRAGLGQSLLDLALDSPLWKYVLVPQARQKMVDTAASNGIPWDECKKWIQNEMKNDITETMILLDEQTEIPSYYQKPFHAYPDGNLCWEAACEAEIASSAVGARNFPDYGKQGETAFRDAFSSCLQEELGAHVPEGALIIDLGCSTGLSTRRLGEQYPEASRIIGFDLSPYFVKVAQRLLELAPIHSILEESGGSWVNSVKADNRLEFRVGAAESTGLPENSVDVVNLQFVAHELPINATLAILREAHRILKPSTGQLWFCEMDFETPGYAAQRANPLLFSLIRSTEPYLDEYADHANDIRAELKRLFSHTKMGAATGRHFAVVAVKETDDKDDISTHTFEDLRWDSRGNYAVDDTHLKVWENKK